jgi:hypothetical protein
MTTHKIKLNYDDLSYRLWSITFLEIKEKDYIPDQAYFYVIPQDKKDDIYIIKGKSTDFPKLVLDYVFTFDGTINKNIIYPDQPQITLALNELNDEFGFKSWLEMINIGLPDKEIIISNGIFLTERLIIQLHPLFSLQYKAVFFLINEKMELNIGIVKEIIKGTEIKFQSVQYNFGVIKNGQNKGEENNNILNIEYRRDQLDEQQELTIEQFKKIQGLVYLINFTAIHEKLIKSLALETKDQPQKITKPTKPTKKKSKKKSKPHIIPNILNREQGLYYPEIGRREGEILFWKNEQFIFHKFLFVNEKEINGKKYWIIDYENKNNDIRYYDGTYNADKNSFFYSRKENKSFNSEKWNEFKVIINIIRNRKIIINYQLDMKLTNGKLISNDQNVQFEINTFSTTIDLWSIKKIILVDNEKPVADPLKTFF